MHFDLAGAPHFHTVINIDLKATNTAIIWSQERGQGCRPTSTGWVFDRCGKWTREGTDSEMDLVIICFGKDHKERYSKAIRGGRSLSPGLFECRRIQLNRRKSVQIGDLDKGRPQANRSHTAGFDSVEPYLIEW
jgi:hypothetical protein